MRIFMIRSVAFVALIVASCADPADDMPLRGSEGGLSALQWGDGPEEVLLRMQEMPDVRLIRDTVEINAFAAWMTPDTVNIPRDIRRYRRLEFRGGTFLGCPAEWWLVTLDDATSFRTLQVTLGPFEDAGETLWRLRRQLRRLYGGSDEPDVQLDRYFADGWSAPAQSSSDARTEIEMGKYGSTIAIGFVDHAWEKRRAAARIGWNVRRMHVEEWRRYLKALAKERGWRIEDLPPQ